MTGARMLVVLFPGALARAANGDIHVGSFAFGVAVWQPSTRAFAHVAAGA